MTLPRGRSSTQGAAGHATSNRVVKRNFVRPLPASIGFVSSMARAIGAGPSTTSTISRDWLAGGGVAGNPIAGTIAAGVAAGGSVLLHDHNPASPTANSGTMDLTPMRTWSLIS